MFIPWEKRLELEADRPRTFSAEIENERNYTSNPSHAFVEHVKTTLLEVASSCHSVVTPSLCSKSSL